MNKSHARSICLGLSLSLAGCGGPDGLGTSVDEINVVGPNLLANGEIETVDPNGPVSDMTTAGSGVPGISSALAWRTFMNTPGSIHTDLSPTFRPGAAGNMIHVVTDGTNNGLTQGWDSFHHGAATTFMYAWVFVRSGSVGIGVGDGGGTGLTVTTNVHNQWVRIEGPNGNAPANTFIIDSVGGPADFYVDSAGVMTSNLVANSDFETAGPQAGQVWVFTPPGQNWGGGISAADQWGVWMNAAGRTMTELVPSTRPVPSPGKMIHVLTGITNSGIQQRFHAISPTSVGITRTRTSVWVFVRSGQVGVGTGDQGSTALTAHTALLNQWVELVVTNNVGPSNQLVVDSYGGAGADFYVDAVSVVATP